MHRNTFIIAIFMVYFLCSCSSNNIEVQRVNLNSEVINDEIYTMMPGDLILADNHLIWSDPFAREFFLHVHSASTGKELGVMGKVGEGPKEFVTPMINRSCVDNKIFAMDANGNTVGYLSIDSLLSGKDPFCEVPEEEKKLKMEKIDNNFYIKTTDNGVNSYFQTLINNKMTYWGVYPIPEIKNHVGSYMSYDPTEELLVFSSFQFPYLALYKKENSTFTLQWERKPDIKNYQIVDDRIIFDRKISGIRDICMSKDYIITLERDREKDPIDETTVRRDISKCPRTVFLYDYSGNLLKIVDLGMPTMRIAADRNSNVLYLIGGNPDYVLAKCEL